MSGAGFSGADDGLTDVQRRGVDAASAVVERLIASVDGPRVDAEPSANGAEPEDEWDGVARLWRESLFSLAAAMTDRGGGPVHVDVVAGPGGAPVRVTLSGATLEGATEVWLDNPTATPIDKVRLHCAAPIAHDGESLDGAAITFDPDSFELPARSSRGVEVRVSAQDALPGTYRAVVLAEGLPEQWLVIEISVPAP